MNKTTTGRVLDFHPGPVDERDHQLAHYITKYGVARTRGSQMWTNTLRLDQGQEGACVGYGWTQSVNASPLPHKYGNDVARSIYYRARQVDEWPGEDYEGTSVRAGAKACVEKKWIRTFAFTQDVTEVALWVLNKRPVTIGVDWWEGMEDALKQDDYFIKVQGEVMGGHCVCVDGVNWGMENSYFRILNSWSKSWGYGGRCKISVPDLDKLLSSEDAVACTAIEI